MTDSPEPRRRSTHLSAERHTPDPDAGVIDDAFERTELSERRINTADLEQTEIAVRGTADDEDFEATELGQRRTAADDDDLEPTDPGARRSRRRDSDDLDVEATELGSRRSARAADDDAEATELATRRTGTDLGETQRGSRGGGEDLERTRRGRRSRRQAAALEDDTVASVRQSESRETTSVSARAASVAVGETFTVGNRRTTRITPDPTGPTRIAASPQPAILKAPYRPRKQLITPVVRTAPAPSRPRQPIEVRLASRGGQKRAGRRTVTSVLVAGGCVIVACAGGLAALLLAG